MYSSEHIIVTWLKIKITNIHVLYVQYMYMYIQYMYVNVYIDNHTHTDEALYALLCFESTEFLLCLTGKYLLSYYIAYPFKISSCK